MVERRTNWVLPPELGSIPQARHLIAAQLVHLSDEVLQVVLLLSTELVTNAVQHGAGPVGVDLVWDGVGVRVEVADSSPRRPVLGVLDPDAVSGRGLFLVEDLASRWGVLTDTPGKKVWFDVDLT